MGSAEKDMEQRLQRIEERFQQILRREDQKTETTTMPLDLWLDGGIEDGGILLIRMGENVNKHIGQILRNAGYKFSAARDMREIMSAFKKASYSIAIVPWMVFESSAELVALLRKAFPQTKIIITSSEFAWSSENMAGASRGMEALRAGAYSYLPEQHITESVLRCVESALQSKVQSCPVLTHGLPCNLRCTL